MVWWKKEMIRYTEAFIFLGLGLVVTLLVLRDIYEGFGIMFLGNTWVTWFAVSFLLFAVYSLAAKFVFVKSNEFYRKRIRSISFLVGFAGALYIVTVPFFKGELLF
ncbi:hypothetical protein [Alteribacter keqinensis]|uniref:Uncharacterized protein n=1 Tax=Alteribacter keqinensis TaxID=2483800 RepID=A0A3M7TNK4_9BACI|nr:hypothetical protein [Alteribacter keqinensis]RNA67115.1 hypothetical protein EBO34_18170 [Alteribacter keqinensis]